MRRPLYRRAYYECDYGKENGEQTDAEENIDNAPVIPRIDPELLRERKELGICHRSTALRHHRGDFSVADLRRCRRAERVSPAQRELNYRH